MKKIKTFKPLQKKQSGVVIVVCLVLLLVVTALGLSTMGGTGLEMKMSSSFRDRAVAFDMAEEALSVAESWILEENLTNNNYISSCTGNNCFTETCDAGLCAFFSSSDPYTDSVKRADCVSNLEFPSTSVWEWAGATNEPNLWLDESKSVEVNSSHPNVVTDSRYIIELMCYTDKTVGNKCDSDNPQNCAPRFRITALGRGVTSTTVVMLQSVYKKVNASD